MAVDLQQLLKEHHTAWAAANKIVRGKEVELAAALLRYEAGKGPMPTDLINEVHELRRSGAILFSAVVRTLNAISRIKSTR